MAVGTHCSWLLRSLLPSLWEAEVAISAVALLAAAVALLLVLDETASATSPSSPTTKSYDRDRRGRMRGSAKGSKPAAEPGCAGDEITLVAGSSRSRSTTAYVIKVELVSAKYLIGANLNGTSEPYAVISLGEQKRFSPMVPSSRNPVWGEAFSLLAGELPAEVTITVYDWDNVCKRKVIGSVTVAILAQDETGAVWYDLDSRSGQICLRISSKKVPSTSDSFFKQYTGAKSQRKMILTRQRLAMTEDSGPLHAITEFPHDQIVQHSYSCALERSFLRYGRMCISAWHLCFQSHVFSKQLNVIIPLQDIYEIRRSQHSLINPAITIVLHTGAGDHGVPPLCCHNGSIRYKFTSFWNRNRTFRALETALQSYRATLEAEKQVSAHLLLKGESMNVIRSRPDNIKTEDRRIGLTITFQPFINEHVLVDITSNTFPGTPEKFFTVILGEDAMFFQQYRNARKDTDLKLSKWHVSDEYGGNVREVTFRSLCHSPLCPPDTAVTELQHASFSNDKRNLIYETKQQAHDVPFGSYFEIHCRWSLRTTSSSTCQVDIKIGVNMKKWCILQSKIKSGATDEYRREVCKILEAASDYTVKAESNGPAREDIVVTSSA
ncbi:BAG-associated GRAM protein 1-like isoform X1 [Hordeum vulgare subsp. vulgare]|uniref:C2 domain-containing protein n=1 Tax=Hordeum vulgare subsp. vulgare TaxID=112509 RepID=A0A8I7BH18_HORVV|nr:BAG-associated GRAM protein 1-like isoform X1 [Hordeum vulgare subsp. vulgare]